MTRLSSAGAAGWSALQFTIAGRGRLATPDCSFDVTPLTRRKVEEALRTPRRRRRRCKMRRLLPHRSGFPPKPPSLGREKMDEFTTCQTSGLIFEIDIDKAMDKEDIGGMRGGMEVAILLVEMCGSQRLHW